MPRRSLLPAALAGLGALLLAAVVVAGFVARDATTDGPVTALGVLGTVLAAAGIGWGVLVERQAGGLDLVAAGSAGEPARLPDWEWWAPLALVAVCDLVTGAFASVVLLVLGLLVALSAAAGYALVRRSRDGALPRPTVSAARRVLAFGEQHAVRGDAGATGGPAAGATRGAVEHMGARSARLVLVGADGAFGDVVLRDVEQARLAAVLAGVELLEPAARELGAAVRTGRYEWTRMAGLQVGGGQNR